MKSFPRTLRVDTMMMIMFAQKKNTAKQNLTNDLIDLSQ
jgi:hypothetical protein